MPFSQNVYPLSDLMDAALTEQLRRVWGRQPDGESLESLFPTLSTEAIAEALNSATMLLASAFSAGHESLSTATPNLTAIVTRLRTHHPGFSDSGYFDVINFGCFLAR